MKIPAMKAPPTIKGKPKPHIRMRKLKPVPAGAFPTAAAAFPPSGGPADPTQGMAPSAPGGMPGAAGPGDMGA